MMAWRNTAGIGARMSDLGEVSRKLVAVFAADVEGYSRLMCADEAALSHSTGSLRKHRGAWVYIIEHLFDESPELRHWERFAEKSFFPEWFW
jgi:hypothetical protein